MKYIKIKRKFKITKIKNIKPKKLSKELTWEETYIHRKINCLFYENCLNHAAIFNWLSFSCINCDDFINFE